MPGITVQSEPHPANTGWVPTAGTTTARERPRPQPGPDPFWNRTERERQHTPPLPGERRHRLPYRSVITNKTHTALHPSHHTDWSRSHLAINPGRVPHGSGTPESDPETFGPALKTGRECTDQAVPWPRRAWSPPDRNATTSMVSMHDTCERPADDCHLGMITQRSRRISGR